ncbi:LysR family transcriptional regulator [Acidocella sp.]|uniref:LysR family transcriptional regulator n=1 Tax=Acidocella sp. TaxID=50710 RepID=UPI003D026C97
MNIRRLQCFVVLAEELHFGRAAERLFLSQPPLTRHIQLLEQELGVELLKRDHRHVSLTEAGQVFLSDARRLISLSERARDNARRAAAKAPPCYRVGHSGSVLFCADMQRIIPRLRELSPHIKFLELPTIAQYEALQSETIDLGFNMPFEIDTPSSIQTQLLFVERLAVCRASLDGEPATRSIDSLRGLPLIIYAPEVKAGLYNKVMRLYRLGSIIPSRVIEVTQIGSIPILVASGIGIAVLPESMSNLHWAGVCFDKLIDDGAAVEIHMAKMAVASLDIFTKIGAIADREAAD